MSADIAPKVSVEFLFVGAHDSKTVLLRCCFDDLHDTRKGFGSSEAHDEKSKLLRVRILSAKPVERHGDFWWMRLRQRGNRRRRFLVSEIGIHRAEPYPSRRAD